MKNTGCTIKLLKIAASLLGLQSLAKKPRQLLLSDIGVVTFGFGQEGQMYSDGNSAHKHGAKEYRIH